MRTFGLLGLGLVLLAGGPALAGVADQPEKARSHPLDTREPRQEIIERPDTNGPRDPSAPAVEDGRQGHSTRDRPIEDRAPECHARRVARTRGRHLRHLSACSRRHAVA